MEPLLLFGHAGLGALALVSSLVFRGFGEVWARIVAVMGVVLAAALVLFEGSWRGVVLERPGSFLVAAGVAAGWIAVIGRPGANPPVTAAATGIVGTAAALAASTDWAVPAGLFLLCAFAATAVDLFLDRSSALLGVALAAVAAVAGIVVAAGDGWVLGEGADLALWLGGASVLFLAAAAAGRLGPRTGGASLFPLLAGLLLIFTRSLSGPRPAVGAAILLAGSLMAIGAARISRVSGVVFWAIATGLGLSVAVPEIAVAAGIAVIASLLAAAGISVPRSYGPIPFGLTLGMAAPTLGAVVVARVVAEAYARLGPGGAGGVGWAMVAVAPLIALAVGGWLASDLASSAVAVPRHGPVRAPLALGLAVLLSGPLAVRLRLLDAAPLGAEGGVLLLTIFAVAAGISTAWFVYAREDATIASVEESLEEMPEQPGSLVVASQRLELISLVLLAGVLAGTAWFTLRGLQVGFL